MTKVWGEGHMQPRQETVGMTAQEGQTSGFLTFQDYGNSISVSYVAMQG